MERVRKPFEGVWNIIRFNWHFYVAAAALLVIAFWWQQHSSEYFRYYLHTFLFLVGGTTLISLLVSLYVYDISSLYTLEWLNAEPTGVNDKIANIHAGFDEISILLSHRYGYDALTVLDFYDSSAQTEVSIRRARAAYPPFPNTQRVQAQRLPLADGSMSRIFIFMAAHEIRHYTERVAFFQEVCRVLEPHGQVVVVEHLRDAANFAAYTIGFLHFYSPREWRRVFRAAGLSIEQEKKLTPFVSAFILTSSGSTP